MKLIFAIVFALALFACQSMPEANAPAAMEFRSEVDSDEIGAMEFTFEGKEVFLSQPRIYEMRLFESQDMLGKPALGFTPTDHKREEFGDYTEALKGKRMAILADGKILAFPYVNSRLSNGGVIDGGGGGFTSEAVADLIATIQSGSNY